MCLDKVILDLNSSSRLVSQAHRALSSWHTLLRCQDKGPAMPGDLFLSTAHAPPVSHHPEDPALERPVSPA